MSNAELRAARTTFETNSELLDMDFDSMNDAFTLVESYESTFGPMFLNSKTNKWDYSNGFPRDDTDDGYTLERIMIVVQQAILDQVYQGTLPEKAFQTRLHDPIVENCRDYLRGKYWETSKYFPGFVALDSNQPTTVHSVQVDATVGQFWGKNECFSDSPTIHATGLYVPPGGVAWVIVPSALVDKGFQIQVGAHDADMNSKGNIHRMPRVSCTYDVKTAKTYVASPLGGGIYIKVPYLSNYGIQSLSISGDVIEAPFFCKFKSSKNFLVVLSNLIINSKIMLFILAQCYSHDEYQNNYKS